MARVSVVVDQELRYPAESPFSPSERYAEYRFANLSSEPNGVYAAVRTCLAQAGLDEPNFGKAIWNPLGQWIKPGHRVFVLCNFVHNRRMNESACDFASKCTHGSVIRAVLDYVLIATGPEGHIRFGNAPVQSCRWDAVLEETRAIDVAKFYQSVGAPIEARDLRLFVAERSTLGAVTHLEQRNEADAIHVNLANRSLFAEMREDSSPRFRLSDYDSRRTEAFHSRGGHIYVVHRDVLESDVIVSIPKLKTHEKVGITCALKGCVGAIAHKDCLAHHRFGSPDIGGDEYPSDRFHLKRMVSTFHDWVYRSEHRGVRGNLLRVVDRLVRSGMQSVVPVMAGGWRGNDTAWRMALDIARILRYADGRGMMHNESLRPHLAFIDGVVGGEGPGPLKPSAVPSGALLFGEDLPMVDFAAAHLMGFEPARIPLVRRAFDLTEYPMTNERFGHGDCILNGRKLAIDELHRSVARRFAPPPGWRHFVEATNGVADDGVRRP